MEEILYWLQYRTQEHRIAAYRFYINRQTTLPTTKIEKDKEWNVILNTAHSNGFSTEDINKLKKSLLTQQNKKLQECTNGQNSKKYGPLLHIMVGT